jgi:hypothetical protein
MVNHLWLEDTYAKWSVMTVTDPRYTHFPRRTNLMEVVGQTRVDLTAIMQFFESDDDVDMETADSSPDDVVAPTAAKNTAKPPMARPADRNAPVSTPAPKKRKSTAEEESPAPPSTGRKAKERAAARLHDTIMPDVAQYQKELKRKGGVLGGGRSRAGSVDSNGGGGSKNKRSKSVESGDEKVVKKGKKRPPKPTIFLLITGYDGWLEQPQKEDAEKVCVPFPMALVDLFFYFFCVDWRFF